MRVVYSDTMPEKIVDLDDQLWLYNAMDCCITAEVYENAGKPTGFAYDMMRTMQGPALTLMLRGCLIDNNQREISYNRLSSQYTKLEALFWKVTEQGLGKKINPRSPDQLKDLFYNLLLRPEILIYDRVTRSRKVSTNREALEKLSLDFPSSFFTKIILQMRDLAGLLRVVKTGVDVDGRMRCSYAVAGPYTGRWSSRASVFGSGTNLQNITDEMRRMFICAPGRKMCQIDLSQAESVLVAALSGDENYWSACFSGDLHTAVAKIIWPNLPWTGDKKRDRAIADQPFYRNFTYRDLAKRGGHGANYGATAVTIAKHLNIPVQLATEFLAKYFKAFPGIATWQQKVAQQLALNRTIVSPFGRACQFLGRPWETDTIKAAIAYAPQSGIGDILNQGLYKVWKAFDLPGTREIDLLLQVHDAIVFDYPEETEEEIVPKVLDELQVPVVINGKLVKIGAEATTGWNWGKVVYNLDGTVKENPFGQQKFRGRDDRVKEDVAELDKLIPSHHYFVGHSRNIPQMGGFSMPICFNPAKTVSELEGPEALSEPLRLLGGSSSDGEISLDYPSEDDADEYPEI